MKKFKLHNYGKGYMFWTYEDEDGSTKTITLAEMDEMLRDIIFGIDNPTWFFFKKDKK